MSRNQFVHLSDVLPTSLFERPGIFEMDGDNILLGKVKAGFTFYDPDTKRQHVEIPGVLYADFPTKAHAMRSLAKSAKRLLPFVRERALATFRAAHPYLTQLMEVGS
jgi:hypothetical protein